MQSWHEAGFFTQDLLMKRTELDSTWTPFGDMLKRATTSQIFMLPPPPPVPAEPPNALGGLGLGTVRRPVNDLPMASPIQPIPARPIRGNTFDGLTNHLQTPTDSPASSFTGGRFANGSPDPLAFGGRPFANAADPVIGSRFNGSGGTPDLASPFRRNTYGDTPDAGYGLPSAFNGATGSPAVGGFGMNGGMESY
jgi:PERQ amino acid-rich with GYF domain-containing protein